MIKIQLVALDRPVGEWLTSTRGTTPADWEATRRNVGERVFAALYQGMPSPPGGGIFLQDQARERNANARLVRNSNRR